MKNKLIYVAGPFTAKDDFEIEQNIVKAEAWAAKLIAHEKCAVIVPHSLGRNFKNGPGSPAYWYQNTLAIMERCDAILLAPGWENSTGSVAEVSAMESLGGPVFSTVEAAVAWLDAQ